MLDADIKSSLSESLSLDSVVRHERSFLETLVPNTKRPIPVLLLRWSHEMLNSELCFRDGRSMLLALENLLRGDPRRCSQLADDTTLRLWRRFAFASSQLGRSGRRWCRLGRRPAMQSTMVNMPLCGKSAASLRTVARIPGRGGPYSALAQKQARESGVRTY